MWTDAGAAPQCWILLLLTMLTSSLPRASSDVPGDTFVDPSVDYDDHIGITAPPGGGSSTREGVASDPCYRDLCRDLPAPCAQLRAEHQCSCPGAAVGPKALPDAPVVKIFWRKGQAPEVRWCAAHADKTSYRVLVSGQERAVFQELKRTMVLESLTAGTEVCVVAVNEVGESQAEDVACDTYAPPEGSHSVALWVGLIGGAIGLVIIAGIAFLVWRAHLRKQRRRGANTRTLA